MDKQFGQTFVIVTHDRKQFGEVDRVITIKDGRAFEDEEPPTMEITA
jgi:lipoprotein-releasing system ATP-binding protein